MKLHSVDGTEFHIDDEDLILFPENKFYKDRGGIVVFRNKRFFKISRIIMKIPYDDGMDVDHIDGDIFNNRKSNLRVCSHSQNCCNRGKCKTKKSSKYKGVCFFKRDNKWKAEIMKNRKKNSHRSIQH